MSSTVVTSPSLTVTDAAFRTTVATSVGRIQRVTASVDRTTVPALTGLTDPYLARPMAGLLPSDLTSAG